MSDLTSPCQYCTALLPSHCSSVGLSVPGMMTPHAAFPSLAVPSGQHSPSFKRDITWSPRGFLFWLPMCANTSSLILLSVLPDYFIVGYSHTFVMQQSYIQWLSRAKIAAFWISPVASRLSGLCASMLAFKSSLSVFLLVKRLFHP